MASTNHKGSASALPAFDLAATVGQKVVRLPTAARRKVKQNYNRQTREKTLPMRQQWPGRYIFPTIREKMKQAELIDSVKPSAALSLAMAIFMALDEDHRAAIESVLWVGAELGRHSHAQAHALLPKVTTVGKQADLNAALRIIRGED